MSQAIIDALNMLLNDLRNNTENSAMGLVELHRNRYIKALPPAQEHPDTACPACNGILAQGWRCWTCGRTGPISVACIAPEAQR